MSPTLAAAAASLADLQTQLASAETSAPAFYELVAAADREIGRMRGKMALFLASPGDATDNAKGFAQNVLHALDGLERVVTEAQRTALAVAAVRRDFTAQIASWVKETEPVAP